MTPTFAAAVDPIFLRVLDLLDRISRNQGRSPQEEYTGIQNVFREAEARVGELTGWELAKYALVAWIDDVLIEAPWDGREWWENNSLEFAYFKTRDRATEFYIKARAASELTRRDILEVFYVCVMLGFRGMYALKDAAFLADQLQLPIDLPSWASRTAQSIQIGHGRAGIRESLRTLAGAPALEGKYQFVGNMLMTAMLTMVLMAIVFFFYIADK
jgi:type VI secretion system protein ImpK